MKDRHWHIFAALALMLASASMALSAFLFTNLRDVSLQGCDRQNGLRHELNETLRSFHHPPRFRHIDCERAYSLHHPF